MALSGSVKVAATTEDDLVFSWAATQSAADNTSVIAWQTKLVAKAFGMIITSDSGYKITVGDQVFTGKANLSIGNNETKLLASGQTVIHHDPEGLGSFAFAVTHNFYITFGGVRIEEVSLTGEAVLDPIPRSSFPTAEDGVLGQPITLHTNRVADFTHTFTYQFGEASGVIARGVTDTCLWTPPPELAEQIPNAAAGTAVITCATFDGDSQVGAAQQVTVVLTVPESLTPSVSAVWEDASGAFDALQTLVQNVSRLAVEVTGVGIHGSTVTSAAVSLEGKPYAGGTLTSAGQLTLVASVTDSRGRVGTAAYPITVAAYSPPALTLSASRCQEDGTADDTGEFALVTLSGQVSDVEGRNASGLTLYYGGTELPLQSSVGAFVTQKIIPADSTRTLPISAVLTDRLLTAERSMTLSTGYATLDLLKGGRGIAFGKSATREGFECAMPAYFTGGISGAEPAYESSGNPGCYIRTVGGETEWLNPPMGRNTEYRTTERWTGKSVYTKLITFGILPNTGVKAVETGIDTISDVVRIDGRIKESGGSTWNALHGHEYVTDVWVVHGGEGKYVGIKTSADLSDREAFVQIWYTKD